MVLLQVEEDAPRAELGILVRDHLGEAGGGADDDAGIAVEWAVGRAALGALVDVASEGSHAVGGLVVLGELAFAGELEGADYNGGAVGVELVQGLLGGDDPGLIESILDGLLEIEHRRGVGDLDLDGERGLGAGDDGSGHGSASRVKENRTLPQEPLYGYIIPRSNPCDRLRPPRIDRPHGGMALAAKWDGRLGHPPHRSGL